MGRPPGTFRYCAHTISILLTKCRPFTGPISSVTVFGKTVVIINELQTAIDLLNQRSTIYSGRPIFTFAGEMYVLSMYLRSLL